MQSFLFVSERLNHCGVGVLGDQVAVDPVDHRGRLVADDLAELDRVRAPLDVPGDERVPQQVRVDPALDAGLVGEVAAGGAQTGRCFAGWHAEV